MSDIVMNCIALSRAALSAVLFVALPATAQIVRTLTFDPYEAKYSRQLNRFVSLGFADTSGAPIIVDPDTGTDIAVPMPSAQSVSIGPDGIHAAIGFSTSVKYYNLATRTVEQTYATSFKDFSPVLAGDGFIYFPPTYSIELSTGRQRYTGHIGDLPVGPLNQLHPVWKSIYTGWVGLARYDFSNGSVWFSDNGGCANSRMNGGAWLTEDGQRLIASCGYAFARRKPVGRL